MHCAGAHGSPAEFPRHDVEVAQIARRFGAELKRKRNLSYEQLKALDAIEYCRTARLGGHVDVCPECGHQRPAYNSCRNRNCPKCQWLLSQRWLDNRLDRILPVHHFHVVFTIPSQLRYLVMTNKKELFSLLFDCAASTLKKLGSDDKRLGAQLGISAVLHTWSKDLSVHPHIHCVVSGGGISDTGQWVETRPGFLFPVKVMGKLFRGVFVDKLKRLYSSDRLKFVGRCAQYADPECFQTLVEKLYSKCWNVYSKKPFAGVQSVYAYLGKYTHRIGISNQRLISFTDQQVAFYTRFGKTATLSPLSFLSRLLTHVLPNRFVRLRHFGLYASSNVHGKLEQARTLLVQTKPQLCQTTTTTGSDNGNGTDHGKEDWIRRYMLATGIDLSLCPKCGRGPMIRYKLDKDLSDSVVNCTRAPPANIK